MALAKVEYSHLALYNEAITELEGLREINTFVSARGWSVVCPQYGPSISLNSICLNTTLDIRTIEYFFHRTQATPHPHPSMWMVILLTRTPTQSFVVNMSLFINCETSAESRLDLSGEGYIRQTEDDVEDAQCIFHTRCRVVKGSGVFSGIKGGFATAEADWTNAIRTIPNCNAEWNNVLWRRRPAQWTFLLKQQYAAQLELALLKECQ